MIKLQRHVLPVKQQLWLVGALVAVLLLVEAINLFSLRSLTALAVMPRQLSSLPLVLIAPFIHGNLWHFIANIFPFAVLAMLLLQHGTARFIWVSVVGFFFAGILTWCLGRDVAHLGINGVLYAYLGFLLVAGVLSKELKLTAISIAVGVFYGGMVFGVLPLNSYISWESNLFGFISGVGCALLLARAAPKEITIEI